MARVPTYDEPQVEQRGPTDARFQAADFTQGADALSRGLQQASRTVDHIGDQMDEAAAKQLDVEYSAFERQSLYDPKTGLYSMQGANALNARADVEKGLRDKITELLDRAKSPQTKRMLGDVLSRRLDQSLDGVARYSIQQGERYADDTSSARQESSAENAVTYRDDPVRREQELHTLRDEVITQGTRKGWAPEMVMMQAGKAVSDAHRGIVEAIAADDPEGAQRYATVHGDEIDAKDQVAIERMLKPEIKRQTIDEHADAIRGTGTAVSYDQPVKADALIAAVTGQESSGRNGLVSPKGALGTMQVMPDTAKAVCAKLGIAFDPERLRTDPAYCTRIGTAYLQQQLDRYGGNATLALAAYNAGPGAVDKWIKANGDPRKGEISNAEWAQRIPYAETRAYVPGVIRKLGGAAPTNAPQENDLAGQLKRADLIAEPEIRDGVRAKLLALDSVDQRLLNDQRQRTFDTAWNSLDSTGKVPPSVMASLSPGQQRQLRAEMERNAKGATVHTDPIEYNRVYQMSVEHPAEFARLDINQLRGVFSPEDIRRVGAKQIDIRTNGPKGPKAITDARIHSVTTPLAEAAGLTLTGTKGTDRATTAARLVAFRGRVSDDVEAYIAEHKKQPDDATIQKFADKWLIEVSKPGTGGLFGVSPDEKVRLFETKPGEQVVIQVPNAFRAQVVAAARRHGVQPTEDDIGKLYLRSRGR